MTTPQDIPDLAGRRILLSTTSYQDTPGPHHDMLAVSKLQVVRDRGPLSEQRMLELVAEHGGFDGLLNGDDAITARVIDAALDTERPLRVIAKYGIGLDSIDVPHATARRVPVLFTPGVNHTTVAEHAIGLMIALAKQFWPHAAGVKQGQWKRQTGHELAGKTLGVLGMGRIGKEVILRGRAFGMPAIAYDVYWDEDFAAGHHVRRAASIDDLLAEADVVTLHVNLSAKTQGLINAERLTRMKDGAMLINTARGGLIVEDDVADACRSGKLWGYGADVLAQEPIQPPHPFQDLDNVLITPHVGSRTYESVQRQATRATLNLINCLAGRDDYIQANEF